MRIDIVTYEEGFLIVAKIIKKGVSTTNVPVKVRSKTIVTESVIHVQLHLSGRRDKFKDLLELYIITNNIFCTNY